MFFHNFKYTLKTLFGDRMLIFWTFAFPIILGTFFQMAFSDIEKNERFDIIDIAIVDNADFQNNAVFKETFRVLSDNDSKNQMFKTKYVSEKEAKKLLEDDKIAGYLLMEDNTPKIFVTSNGTNETILKFVTEEITQTEGAIQNIIMTSIAKQPKTNSKLENEFYHSIYQEVIDISKRGTAKIEDISSNNLSYTMIEFYTLIAMSCLYGGMLSMVAVNRNLANMSTHGKRISVSPTSKGKLIISSILASYFTQLIGLALLLVYTIFVLHVDYGTNFLPVVLLALVGSLSGQALGVVVAVLFKTSENTKVGILISITMLGCFLSGMMGVTMKYVIDKNIPILNKCNPASMITDGFYSLYYYETLDRFWFNIMSLLVLSVILIGIAVFKLRRQKYDSI